MSQNVHPQNEWVHELPVKLSVLNYQSIVHYHTYHQEWLDAIGICTVCVLQNRLYTSSTSLVHISIVVAANILEKSTHTFADATLEVRPFEPPVEDNTSNNTLEISNLPQECDEDAIQLYFENPKSGGCPGGVKNVQIIGNGVVRIQFIDDRSKYI